jgi:glycerophosphoryl diester phosphodiesterase
VINSFLKFLPPVIAHRGASRYAPENTMSAFTKAFELGCHWIECDVMLTQDRHLVIFHDDSLERTTNGYGEVSNHSLTAIRKLDAGTWFQPFFSGERVPLLIELLSFINQQSQFANIEIKAKPHQEITIANKIEKEIRNGFSHLMRHLLFSSFSIEVLTCLRQQSADFLLGLLLDEWRLDWADICHSLQCVSLHLNHHLVTRDRVKQIKSAGLLLLAYTVNDEYEAKRLFDLGVDAVFSDVPDLILKSLGA